MPSAEQRIRLLTVHQTQLGKCTAHEFLVVEWQDGRYSRGTYVTAFVDTNSRIHVYIGTREVCITDQEYQDRFLAVTWAINRHLNVFEMTTSELKKAWMGQGWPT